MASCTVLRYLFVTMGQMRDTERYEPEFRSVRRGGRASLVVAGWALPVVLAMFAAGAVAAEPEASDAPSSPLRWSTRSDYVGSNYRWSASRGALDFGLRFGSAPRAGIVQEPHLDAAGPMVSNLPSVSLGLRTVTPDPTAASSLLERAIGTGAAPATSSSVGIEWKPAQPQLAFVRQGLGIRLSGDDRLTMQLRKGTLGIYMKRDF